MEKGVTEKEVNFNAHAQIKSTIGKDLINDDNIAVIELVKNAIDAQSETVSITFDNLLKNEDNKTKKYDSELKLSSLVIQDDGKGMDYADITKKWLNIAYSEKKNSEKVYAGSKGVGRFSCDRLGEFLNIYTRKENGDIYHLHINWNEFENDSNIELKIQDVKLILKKVDEGEIKGKFKGQLKKGTILEITKLRTPWLSKYQRKTRKGEYNREKLLSLKRSLQKIVSPNIELDSHAQLIELSVPSIKSIEKSYSESNKVNGIVENKIFKDLNFKTTLINSYISTDGKTLTTSLIDKDTEILRIKEKNIDYPDIKDTHIKLYYLNQYAKTYFKRQTGIRSVDYGSVFLFLNGFRVSKLGDEGDDWLGLEIRKSQGTKRFLAGRELIGHIEVKDPNHKIGIISAREGITRTPESGQLTNKRLENNSSGFFYKTLRRLERYVVDGLNWDRITKLKEKGKELNIDILINSEEWDESKEKYELSDREKVARIYGAIGAIVDQDTKQQNILDLYINFDFFSQVSDDITNKDQKNFEKFIKKHGIDISSLEELKELKRKAEQEKERAEIAEKAKEEAELSAAKADQARAKAEQDAEEATRAKGVAEASAEQAKKDAEDANNAYEAERKRGAFQGALIGTDKERIVGLQHQIYHSSSRVNRNIKLLLKHLKVENIDDKTKKYIKVISLESSKINSIANFITKANFNFTAEEVKLDLVDFINDYLNEMYIIKDSTIDIDMNIKVKVHDNLEHKVKFRPLEITTILDSFISNSDKAEAKNMLFEFFRSKKKLIINICDDGKGILEKNIDRVFEMGFTTTNGSGIGLYQAYDLITNNMNGQLSVHNSNDKGTIFQIIL